MAVRRRDPITSAIATPPRSIIAAIGVAPLRPRPAVPVAAGAGAPLPPVASPPCGVIGVVTTLPALTVGPLAASHDRLVVQLVNRGEAVPTAGISIRIDGGVAHAIPASALPRPGEAVALSGLDDAFLGEAIVQRRAPVTVDITAADGTHIATRSMIVAPDVPLDLALADARVDAAGTLLVDIRNDSPVPLRGRVVVAAREPASPYTLLARTEAPLDVAAGAVQTIAVGAVGTVGPSDLARLRIALSTDAIDDANLANNVYRP